MNLDNKVKNQKFVWEDDDSLVDTELKEEQDDRLVSANNRIIQLETEIERYKKQLQAFNRLVDIKSRSNTSELVKENVHLTQEVEILKSANKKLEIKEEDRNIEQENYKDDIALILKKSFNFDHSTAVLTKIIEHQFYYLHKNIENIFIPYLMKFENRIRNLFDSIMETEFKFSSFSAYPLQELIIKIIDNKEKFVYFLNERHKSETFLHRICLALNENNAQQWDKFKLDVFILMFHDLKAIRNSFIHSIDIKTSKSLVRENFERTIQMHENKLITTSRRLEIYRKLGLGKFVELKHETNSVNLAIYPLLACILSLFNKRYIVEMIFSKIIYEVNNFCLQANSLFIDKDKVLDASHLSEYEANEVYNFLRKVDIN